MKILITENQIGFIRRYGQIKELVDEGIDVISNDEDFCGFGYSEFMEEVCWQVSDKKFLNVRDSDNRPSMTQLIHDWVRDHFAEHIRSEYHSLIEKLCMEDRWDDADDIME